LYNLSAGNEHCKDTPTADIEFEQRTLVQISKG